MGLSPRLQRIIRVAKYGIFGGLAFGGIYAIKPQLMIDADYESYALVRASRTAMTAIDIGRMYNKMLYEKEWDVKSEEYRAVRSEAHRIGAEKLLNLCRRNKGVYIKVGQHIGALDYMVPSEYVETMRILHSDAPPNHIEDIYKVIRDDLGKEPDEIFDAFEPEPLGTASLAQVHKAKLKDGTDVAVKVQHYFVKKHVDMDLLWIEFVIKVMAKVFPDFHMSWLVDETKRNIYIELDFLQEGKNSETVAEMFSHYTWLKVPKIYWEYSTPRVLTMEYVYGGKVDDLDYIKRHGISKKGLSKKIGDLYSEMIFVNGFVHCDPHPGNILVHQEPGDNDVTIYLLDHGLYAHLTEHFRYHYSKLWLAVFNLDHEEMRVHCAALGVDPEMYGMFVIMITAKPWKSIVKGVTKPTTSQKKEKKIFQKELPNFIHLATHVLNTVDRQALLVLKTNDLVRNIEVTLGREKKQNSFREMARICHNTVYSYDYSEAKTLYTKQKVNLYHCWISFKLFLYGLYLSVFNIL